MSVKEALEDVEIGFRQLEFAIKLLSYCEAGHIKPNEFDTDHLITLQDGDIHLPSGYFSDPDNILKAVSIGVLIAFSTPALVLDKAFEIAGIVADPQSNDPVVRLRTLIYMVRCAQAHGVANPQWEVRGKYRTVLTVDINGKSTALDLSSLDGKPFDIGVIGGYENWYRMRAKAMKILS